MPLSEAQLKLIELDKRKPEIKKFYEEYSAALEAVVAENGTNHYFQDEEGTVYKTVVPDGKFVQFEKFALNRTRRPDEKAGTLSLKEAREAGFEVESK